MDNSKKNSIIDILQNSEHRDQLVSQLINGEKKFPDIDPNWLKELLVPIYEENQ